MVKVSCQCVNRNRSPISAQPCTKVACVLYNMKRVINYFKTDVVVW